MTAFTSSESKFDEARGFGANHVVSSRDSAAIKKLAGTLDLLIVTANVPLDWESLIASLAPNGRMHVVGRSREPIPVAVFPLICDSAACPPRRRVRRWRSRRCSILPHGTASGPRPSTIR